MLKIVFLEVDEAKFPSEEKPLFYLTTDKGEKGLIDLLITTLFMVNSVGLQDTKRQLVEHQRHKEAAKHGSQKPEKG